MLYDTFYNQRKGGVRKDIKHIYIGQDLSSKLTFVLPIYNRTSNKCILLTKRKGEWAMKKGFSLIELIITIAVIGVLAAILVMVIPNAIEKANAKSALSDAKNTLTQCSVMKNDNPPNCVIIVEKGSSYHVFSYTTEKGKLVECKRNPFKANSADELIGRLKAERTLYMSGSDTGFISAIDAATYL